MIILNPTFEKKKKNCQLPTSLLWRSRELLHAKGLQKWPALWPGAVLALLPSPETQTRRPLPPCGHGLLPALANNAAARVASDTSHPALEIRGCGTRAMKCVFVTVGTTSFDDLIACVSAHDSLQVSGGGGRAAAGLAALRSPVTAASLTANLGNLAWPRRSRRTPSSWTSGAAAPRPAPPRAWLGPPSAPPLLRFLRLLCLFPAAFLGRSSPSSSSSFPPGFSPPILRLRLSILRLRPSFQRLRLPEPGSGPPPGPGPASQAAPQARSGTCSLRAPWARLGPSRPGLLARRPRSEAPAPSFRLRRPPVRRPRASSPQGSCSCSPSSGPRQRCASLFLPSLQRLFKSLCLASSILQGRFLPVVVRWGV